MLRNHSTLIAIGFAMGLEAISCFFSPGSSLASDDLPRCSPGDRANWTGCVGSAAISDIGIYVGEFRNGKPNGNGSLTYRAYGEYIGEFREGWPEGRGTYSYADGRQYVGDWRNGEFEGYGTRTYPDGRKEFGEWKASKLIQKLEENSQAEVSASILLLGVVISLALLLRLAFANSGGHQNASRADTAVLDERRKLEEIRRKLVEAVDNFDVSDDALTTLRENGRRASNRLNELKRRTGVGWLRGALKIS